MLFLGFLGVGRWQICFLDKNEKGTSSFVQKGSPLFLPPTAMSSMCWQILALRIIQFFSSIGHSIVILFMFCSGCALPYQELSDYRFHWEQESELMSLGSVNLFRSKYAGKPKKLSMMWGSVLSWWDCPEVTEAKYSVSISFIFLVLKVWPN